MKNKKRLLSAIAAILCIAVIGSAMAFAAENKTMQTNPSVTEQEEIIESKSEKALQEEITDESSRSHSPDLVYKDTGYEELGKTLSKLLLDYYMVLETGELPEFDLSAIDSYSYLAFKEKIFQSEIYNVYYGGIQDVKLSQLTIETVQEGKEYTDVRLYAAVTYTFNGEGSGQGTFFNVRLIGATLVSITLESTEIEMYKSQYDTEKAASAHVNLSKPEEFDVIDKMFAEKTVALQRESKEILNAQATNVNMQNVEESVEASDDLAAIQAVSVSYDAYIASRWGWWLGDRTENYVFMRSGVDCTNFVSQCIWAGYGGTTGYAISDLYNTTATGTTATALRGKVANDYRMVTAWWGRNYYSTSNENPAFVGVSDLWDFSTPNTGYGPRATGYNDDAVYTSLSTNIKQGDVLQFKGTSVSYYQHSVIVVSSGEYPVSNITDVRVAQHTNDYYSRPLIDVITGFGGTNCKMRLLRFGSTTYSS
jgi:hypothetical protein